MNRRLISLLACCLPLLLAGGCALTPLSVGPDHDSPPPLNRALFGDPVDIPDVDDIFSLSEQQLEALDEHLARHDDDSELYWQLARFIDGHLSNFDYWGHTLTASEALQDQKGNCMSLAVVTTAFTRHLGLEHDFQLMRTPPTFEQHGDLVLVSDHVRTRIYPSTDKSAKNRSSRTVQRVTIDYFPSRERQPSRLVTHHEFLAMFYRNLAAERMLDDELATAFWFAERANRIDPDNASVLNLLAVMHRRAGDPDTAEALFVYATGRHPDDVNLLYNLHALLSDQGRHEEARAVHLRLTRLPDHDPYPRLALAGELAEQGHLRRALDIYEAVTEQLPHMHEAHWGIAMVRHKQGDHTRARQAMEKALELARAPRHERLYSAKLESMAAEHSLDHRAH